MTSRSGVVCILGMSRSGTSLAARVLELAGVYLGREEELLGGDLEHVPERDRAKARAANPGGFWEHHRLMRLNERILRRMGGNWRTPPPLPAGWELSDELAAERQEARELIADSFDGRPLWGWKDPRNCLTLPFWQHLLPEMRYVLCLRNPIDVAASLERRDGIRRDESLELWLTYVAAGLSHTRAAPRVLVAYDRWFDETQAVGERLADFVGNGDAFRGSAARARLVEVIDGRLWRNRTAPAAVGAEPLLTASMAQLYLCSELLERAEARDSPPPADLRGAIDLCAAKLIDDHAVA